MCRPADTRRHRHRAVTVAALVVALGVAACSDGAATDPASSTDTTSVASTSGTAASTEAATTAAPTSTTAAPTTVAPTSTAPATEPSPPVECPSADPADAADLAPPADEVELVEVGTFDGGTVLAAAYPVPDDLGEPWSQWGEGVALPDGRFVSAVGDHRGRDGRSFLYEYDPATRTLARTVDVSEALGHRAGDWGYGKIHAPMVLDVCDRVVTATYWGTRRGIEYGGSYDGDHLVRYDPASRTLESLGVPAPGHGIPSLSITPDRSVLYVEAVDPASDPDAGRFLAVDTATGEVLESSTSPTHTGFRDVLVTADGTGLHASGDGSLAGLDPSGRPVEEADRWAAGWMRSATDPAPDGTVGFVTRRPDELHRRDPDGTVTSLGEVEGYVASLSLAPDGRTVHYVPGAHGDGWRTGTPLIAADLSTGDRTEVVRLNELIEPALGIGVGGSYDVVVAPDGSRIFVGLNGSDDVEDAAFGTVVLAVVELDVPIAPATADGAGATRPTGACRTAHPVAPDDVDDVQPIAFGEATERLGLLEPLTGMYGHAAAAGDVDGDGWLDLFVGGFADRPAADYAVRGADGPAPDRLLLGGPTGFRVADGFPGVRARTSGATFADLDGDGDLDLVAVRNPRATSPVAAVPTTLYENTGDGWLPRAELAGDVAGRSAAVLDVDRDGRPDLIVAGDRFGASGSRALRNEGDFSFTDVTRAWGVPDDLTGLALTTVDVDADGWRDIVVNGDERILRGGPAGFSVARVPELTWEPIGDEDDPAGIAVGDLDGDGRPDLVLGQHYNSTLDAGARVPVRILLNRSAASGPAFVDVTAEAGSPALWTKSPHVAVADLDADGRPDIVTSAATADGAPLVLRGVGVRAGIPRFEAVGRPGSGDYDVTGVTADIDRDGRVDVFQVSWEPDRPSQLFLNRSDAGRTVEVDVAALDDPAGARVTATLADGGTRTAWAESTTGYAAGAPPLVHLGLGADPPADDTASAASGAADVEITITPAGGDPLELGPVTPGARVGPAPCPGGI